MIQFDEHIFQVGGSEYPSSHNHGRFEVEKWVPPIVDTFQTTTIFH